MTLPVQPASEMDRSRHALATRAVHAGGGPDPTTGAVEDKPDLIADLDQALVSIA